LFVLITLINFFLLGDPDFRRSFEKLSQEISDLKLQISRSNIFQSSKTKLGNFIKSSIKSQYLKQNYNIIEISAQSLLARS